MFLLIQHGNWESPASRISGSSATPSFVMGGQDPVIVETIYKGAQEENGFPTGIVIGLVIVILLIGAFGYFFVELETDEQPKTDIEVDENFGLENQMEQIQVNLRNMTIIPDGYGIQTKKNGCQTQIILGNYTIIVMINVSSI